MKKFLKFNQRANLINEEQGSFSFEMINDKKEKIPFINLNEWRIYSISSYDYFTRKKISFDYSDPNGSRQKIETGGSTIIFENEHGINSMVWLLKELLVHFHRISCFEDITSVKAKREKMLMVKGNWKERNYDHLFMSTEN